MNITEIICLAVIVLLTAIFIVWKIYKQGLRAVAIDLIVEAEKRLKDNQVKFQTVVNGIIIKLPFPFDMIPASVIEKFVQKVFDEVKVALDYGREDK